MEIALDQARLAADMGEVPVGAVLVGPHGEPIVAAHNQRETAGDPAGHAELVAIREGARKLGAWQLVGCTIYVTLEPCPMCAGALVNARVQRLVYGCSDPKAGAVRSLYAICDDPRLNHRLEIRSGVLEERCGEVLSTFFADLREGGE
jgi:tRNA(adenine34) deaminase